jgi:uncharacterized membrane protein
MQRLIAVILTSAAVVWTAAILSAPLLAADGQLPMLTAAIDLTGAVICHQRPDRSFHARGEQLPVCARCTGLYVAGTAGVVVGWLGVAAVPRRIRLLLAAALLPTVVTLAAEWAGLAESSNLVRAAAGLPLGGVAGWLFVVLLRQEGTPGTCAIIS